MAPCPGRILDPTGEHLAGLQPNPRMQPTGRIGARFRAGGALRERLQGSVGLCGRGHDGP
jgi:hypothetical protein